MLYLESFVHRVELAEIVSRWMINQPRPGDVYQLKKIVNFNSYMARIWCDRLTKELLFKLHGRHPHSFVAKNKGQLKDFVVDHPLYTNPRITKMLTRYRRFPEDFYRETPFDGRVYFNRMEGQPLFVGSMRIKRFRRVAEKGSRRIVDFMFERIRAHADDLAQERAREAGIPKEHLISTPQQMAEEFRHAERRLVKSIKKGTIQSEMPVLAIPDVVGIKLIAERDQYRRILLLLERSSNCRLLEKEVHSGNYNAINLRVAHYLPREMLLANPPGAEAIQVLATRGLDPNTVVEEYRAFVESAEDHVLMEIIVSNFQELLESELGRSMHEDRVLAQRSGHDYRSFLATSVRYLMDYMFTLCLAPGSTPISDVPIKLWVKYMPDTLDREIRRLFDVPTDSSFDARPGHIDIPLPGEPPPAHTA